MYNNKNCYINFYLMLYKLFNKLYKREKFFLYYSIYLIPSLLQMNILMMIENIQMLIIEIENL